MRTRVGCWGLVAMFVAACGSGSEFDVDPAVWAGSNPYTFTWEEATDGETVIRDRDYLLYVPEEYLNDPGEAWPLVLYLHGYPGPEDIDELTLFSLPAVVQSTPYRFIMAAPVATNADFNRPGWAWFHSADHLVDFVDHVRSRVNIDPNRIYVTGHSFGATGAWALAASHPDLPAALVTVAGGWNDLCPNCSLPSDWTPKAPANICDMKDIPIWVFHGDADRNVPWEESQAMVDALEACGAPDVRFTVQAGLGHAPVAYEDEALFEWMLAQGTDEPWPLLPSD